MKIKIVCLLLTVLMLSACGAAPSETMPVEQPTTVVQTDPTEAPTQPPETEPPKPVTVYAGAVEEPLLPLEDYSGERTHAPEFVMIHFTSAVVLDKKNPYDMDLIRDIFVDYKVSIHYIIDRDGTVRCYIPEDRVAWHAGKGTWQDNEKYTNTMNQYAIGIEMVAMGSKDDMSMYLTGKEYDSLDPALMGYTEEQYAALQGLVKDLCQRHHIPLDRQHVIGHEEYSENKTDPGDLFDWNRIIEQGSE